MKKIYGYVRENKAELAAILLIAVFFYVQLVNSGIATHDELLNLYQVRVGEFFSHLTWGRWGMTLLNLFPSYLHALCSTQVTYRLFTMAGLLVSCAAFAWFVSKWAGNKAGLLTVILFFEFAQFELEHDGLYSFSFTYQINTCYVFMGLAVFYDYLRTRKKSKLIVSAFLYVLSSMTYEAFILYGALFFLLDVMYLTDEKKLNIVTLFKDLILHASLVTLYVISYIVINIHAAVETEDAAVGTGLQLNEVLKTVWKLATGMFPLNYRVYSWKEFLYKSVELSPMNISRWILILCLMIVVFRAIKKAKNISGKQYLWNSVFCFIGMLLPVALVALTNKFIDWICHQGVKSYSVSYYSYFFIIAWIVITIIFVYQRLPYKELVLLFVVVGIGCVTEFTWINNEVYIKQMADRQVNYDLWCRLTETEYFKGLEDGAQVYTPDYIGIHYDINTLGNYANHVAGTSITTTNDEENLHYDVPVYYVKVDQQNKAIYLEKVDAQGLTNEIYVYSLEDLNGVGILAERKGEQETAELYINGENQAVYGMEIVSGNLETGGTEMVVDSEAIMADTFELYRTSGSYSNELTEH